MLKPFTVSLYHNLFLTKAVPVWRDLNWPSCYKTFFLPSTQAFLPHLLLNPTLWQHLDINCQAIALCGKMTAYAMDCSVRQVPSFCANFINFSSFFINFVHFLIHGRCLLLQNHGSQCSICIFLYETWNNELVNTLCIWSAGWCWVSLIGLSKTLPKLCLCFVPKSTLVSLQGLMEMLHWLYCCQSVKHHLPYEQF